MEWINLVVGARSLQKISMDYSNAVNFNTNFFGPTPSNIIINNETLLNQYNTK